MKSPFAANVFFSLEGAPRKAMETHDIGLETARRNFPELKDLNLPRNQEIARANALAKLNMYIQDPKLLNSGLSQEGGFMKGVTDMSRYVHTQLLLWWLLNKIEPTIGQMKEVRDALLRPYDKSFWDMEIQSWLNGIDPDGTGDFSVLDTTDMSRRVFLERIIGAKNIATILQPTSSSTSVEKRQEQHQQDLNKRGRITRFEMLLSALERNDDGVDRSELRAAHRRLQSGDLDWAHSNFANYFRDRYDIELSGAYNTAENLGETFRKLKYYNDGETQFIQQTIDTKEDLETNGSPTDKKLMEEINTRLQNPTAEDKEKAKALIDKALLYLPPQSPEYAELIANREASEQGALNFLLYTEVTKAFITKNGSNDLSSHFITLNDMSGWSNDWNPSDRTWDIAGEIAIFIAITVITFGAGAAISAAGGAIRGAAVAASTARQVWGMKRAVALGSAVARGAQSIEKWWRIITTWGEALQMGRMMRAAAWTGGHLQTIGKGITTADRAIASVRGMNTLYTGAKFTLTEASLRALFRDEWDLPAFENFWGKFITNTAMFGLFRGMEHFVTWPISARFLWSTAKEAPILSLKWSGNMLVLTAGDVAVMQAMHAIESGTFEFDWLAVGQAMVMRFGITAFSRQFPNLWNRATPEQKQALQKADDTRTSGKQKSQTSAQIGKERLEKILPQDRAATWNPSKHPNENGTFTFPEGIPNQTLSVNGQQWTFKRKPQSWVRNDGKWGSTHMKPGETLVFWSHTPTWTPKQTLTKWTNNAPEVHTFTEKRLLDGKKQLDTAPTGTVVELAIATEEGVGFARYKKQPNGQWNHVESNVSAYGVVDDTLAIKETPPNSKNSHHTFQLESNGLQITEMKFTTPWVQPWTSLIPFRAWQNPLRRIPEKQLPALRAAESQLQKSNLPVPVLENANAVQSYVRTHWNTLSSDIAAVGALITLARLRGRTPDAPIPVIPAIETLTPETLAEICIQCLEGEKSTLDYNRHSDADNRIVLDEKRRNTISQKWIQTTEWQEAMQAWDELVASGIAFREEDELKDKIGRIRENPTVEDVQELQRCIGMIAEDAAIGQDGILGRRTTQALQAFIETCLAHQETADDTNTQTPAETADDTDAPAENPNTPAETPAESGKWTAEITEANPTARVENVTPEDLRNIPDAEVLPTL